MGFEYSVAFHSTAHDAVIRDRPLPGRLLATEISVGLQTNGVRSAGVFDAEPFWEIRCVVDKQPFSVLIYIFQPNEVRKNAIWCISFASGVGLVAKLMGKTDDNEIRKLARKLHAVLNGLAHVYGVRWFNGNEISTDPNAGVACPSDLGGMA